MKPGLFHIDQNRRLTRLQPAEPRSEDELQEVIASYPELLADSDGLLLIGREQGIADDTGGVARWSLDHLYVTRTGQPVLVEVKRASNTQLRREVVGQLLDYAANASVYWPPGSTAVAFRKTMAALTKDPDDVLEEFLGPEADPEAFWRSVELNLAEGRMKLVFVADVIPRELARIVEFLNAQMTAEVRAVELNYYASTDHQVTLAPRLVGETLQSESRKSAGVRLAPMTRDDWVAQLAKEKGEGVAAAYRLAIGALEAAGATVGVSKAQYSLFVRVRSLAGQEFYPMFLENSGRFSIAFKWVWKKGPAANEGVRVRFLNDFENGVLRFNKTNEIRVSHLAGTFADSRRLSSL